ncbi:MAG: alpha-2-macroglobulin family protein [Chitinophagaceae bacterium]
MKRPSLLTLFAALFSLIAMNSNSQTPVKNYDPAWKKVEGFVNKNLPASALAEVKKIYELAKKEKQEAQVIKSLIYITSLQEQTRENNTVLSISEIEKEIPGTSGTTKALLNSLLATKYWSYYQQNRWQFYNRTQTENFKKDDIATWTAEDFHKKTGELYLRSLIDKKALQQTSLDRYNAIIMKGNMRHLRPTLYDLLAFQALSYFENDERDVNKPAYAFEISQASAFDPAADFIHRKFETNDTLSLQHKALLIYQDLIAFHLNDKKHDALIDADLQRYQFVRSKSTHPEKELYYFNGINHIAHQYEQMPAASQAWYLVAVYYNDQGNTYKPFADSTNRFQKIKAKEILQKLVAQKDSSEGKINAINLLNELNRPSLQFHIEQVNLPGKPLRSLIEYRNLTNIHFRLIKQTAALKAAAERSYEENYWKAILAAPSIRSWKQALPDTKDLQQHNAEVKVDALPSGEYYLVASSDEGFKNKSAVIVARSFFVSSISYINYNMDYFVLNRDNGQPLRNASVQVWEQNYDYNTYKYTKSKGAVYNTDENGFFRIARKQVTAENRRNSNFTYALEVKTKDDYLFIDQYKSDYYYSNARNTENKNETTIFLFKDRGIYRPGQTIFFKGIVISRNADKKQSDILSGYSTTVYLQNANGEKVDSVKVKTNEYGSFSGKFQLPSGGLTGSFSLIAEKTYDRFRVEEYKRPKYFVEYEPLKGTYRINDSIEVTGIAKAYAGNNIDGAQVKYRVVRQVRYLYPWLFKRWWYPPSEPMEITHGETTSDAEGKFKVKFAAIPDLKVDPKLDPAFDYVVYADITDINGETRSGQKNVSVSYKSLLLKVDVPERMPADSLNKITIRTTNNNGEFEPALVTVKISRLKEEKRLIRNRLWDRPDQFVFTKEEYLKFFPNDLYDEENDPASWEKGEQVLQKQDSTKAEQLFSLDGMISQAGAYMIEVTAKDKDGKEVKDVKYITLYNEKASRPEQPVYFASTQPSPVEPGKQANIELSSSADNLFVIQQINKSSSYQGTDDLKYSFLKLGDEKKKITFETTEADRGGYGVSWAFVKHNQVFVDYKNIMVPWTNKELKIEYATYRDKTLPGSQEQWRVKIAGMKNEKVAAEMLAGMYDASLDQFASETWNTPYIWPTFSGRWTQWDGNTFIKVESQQKPVVENAYVALIKDYDRLIFNSFGDEVVVGYGLVRGGKQRSMNFTTSRMVADQEIAAPAAPAALAEKESGVMADSGKAQIIEQTSEMFVHGEVVKKNDAAGDIQPRKNFNETAFFFPDLKTDESGAIEFSFTMPEALTKWKFQALAHTKDLAFGYSQKEIITQKELMVQPNAPRFLREGDKLVFNAKVVNLSEKELNGNAELQLFNAATNQPVDILFNLTEKSKPFKVAAGQSTVLFFPLNIPASYTEALTWRVVAKAEGFSDGEENMLPVLTNRMLVTETMSLPMRGNGTKSFSFDKLKQSGNSNTLQQHSLTIEYTSNPAWYAVQALPYLMEYPYDCAEQTWNRYYANSLATSIANAAPKLKQVFEQWKNADTAALLSNLQKNQELKSILLEETPWVLEAKTEAQQKKNIALLFDMMRMSSELNSAYEKLKQLQSSNGGFVWFSGGPDDRYMTQYIVTGIGHLRKLKGISVAQDAKLKQILQKAIPYLDLKMKEEYDNLLKYKTDLKTYVPGYSSIQYFYMRSFFPEYKVATASQTAYNYFRSRLPLSWTNQNKYMQGMLALALHRLDDKATPLAILKSLKETSINNEELGMYWKDTCRGWWWYESPIERQALLIEAFSEITKDTKAVDDLRTWLLKNKQTNKWESTKATAEACYALLLQGTNWVNESPVVDITLGSTKISSADNKLEAGTGYFSKTIPQKDIKSSMGNITVKVSGATTSSAPSWGGAYWQYFENLDKITSAETPLKLQKKLFVETNSDRGPVLTPVNDGAKLKIGDKVNVRIELRVDRDMEYVHMKDMRASSLEPVNVLSSYKWQDGLGYYESTKDAATNFFFDNLRKGTYVFEYSLFVTHSGNFSNGVTTIQSMYAPEFSSHSEGVRITVQ